MTSNPDPRDLRGYKPKTTGLTWRFLGRSLPIVFATYFVGIALLHGWFLIEPNVSSLNIRLTYSLVLTIVSVAFLYPFMLKRMGSSRKEQQREQTWASSSEAFQLAGRQALRYLLAALPVEVLAMIAASALVTLGYRLIGLG
jgi:hypothetical protein